MGEPRDTAGVIAPPPLLALAAVLLGLALDWLLPGGVLTTVLAPWVRFPIAAVLLGAGATLGLFAVYGFRQAGTHVEPWKPSTALVTGGVFGRLRNPMYVGLTLMLAGLAVLLASDWMLVTTMIFVPVIHFGVVRREERYLEKKFGEAYRSYKAGVPRYGWPR
jgi:protein-S-isoprenylcysteine O-methyltransferase Ste14